MKNIIDAKTMKQFETDNLNDLLIKEYEQLWIAKYGNKPKGMHPIPSNVAEDDVQFFIAFS